MHNILYLQLQHEKALQESIQEKTFIIKNSKLPTGIDYGIEIPVINEPCNIGCMEAIQRKFWLPFRFWVVQVIKVAGATHTKVNTKYTTI